MNDLIGCKDCISLCICKSYFEKDVSGINELQLSQIIYIGGNIIRRCSKFKFYVSNKVFTILLERMSLILDEIIKINLNNQPKERKSKINERN